MRSPNRKHPSGIIRYAYLCLSKLTSKGWFAMAISFVGSLCSILAWVMTSGFYGLSLLLMTVVISILVVYLPYLGSNRTASERRLIPCVVCLGRGQFLYRQSNDKQLWKACPVCNRRGEVYTELWSGSECGNCRGFGSVARKNVDGSIDWNVCGECEGYGKTSPK